MKNYIQPGMNIDVEAPAAVSSGDGVLMAEMFGIASTDAASGEMVSLSLQGVYELPKETGKTFAVGEHVHWDDSIKKVTDTGGGVKIGVAVEAAASAATKAKVRLNGSF